MEQVMIGAFRENEVLIFYYAGGKFGEVARVFLAEKTLTGRWLLEHRTLRLSVRGRQCLAQLG